MKSGITISMKTAISVDDRLMEETDKAARDLGLSRSALISEALHAFLRDRRRVQISEQLDQAYANEPAKDERLLVRKLRTKLPAQDRW